MKLALKRLVLAAALGLAFPAILLARLGLADGSEGVFVALACFLSLVPGKTGSYLRLAYYKGTLRNISSDVTIGFGSYFSKRDAQIGRNVSIGGYCVLGNVSLGDDVVVASRVSIPSGKRQHALRFAEENPSEETVFDRVAVGKGCWVGEGAIILADVGERCIVSAGSVVTKPVPHNCVVGGNPARVLRELSSTPLAREGAVAP